MKNIAPKFCLTLLLAGLGLAPAASALAQARNTADIAALQGDARSQELIDAAKKEGELTIYLAHPSVPQVTAAFTKKYGIKVNVWRAGSEAILQRVVTEAHGGRNEVDVVENNAPEMEALHREKLLQDAKSPYTAGLMPQAVPPHKEWVGISIDMFTLAYNTQKVKKEDLPKSWADLADPKWKGLLAVEAEDQGWFAYVLQSLGQEKGTKLFKEIVANNNPSVRKGHSLLGQLVSSGEVALGLDLYSWTADQLKAKGAPIERFNVSEPIVQFQGLGLMKKSPHPNAAVLFFDFMLTDGQEIMSKAHAIATSNKYDMAEKKVPLRYIDPVTAMDLNEQRYKVYQDIFVKRSK
ncbi:MAG TPA: extracellular solute-binding protein [Herbaspirillum sp.]|jgi:iron(III) transport system substrate-binding protein